ncbi:MAG: tRNA preQ1(34) S-adenosylmethionine ribosyltransferase-isomerase QueA [Phycisphaeraceae bacterium]|nr:tRNA preQ1(34) S-adenosylmethionine ribosyltransferase-isomerase QueA [Phycisphaeraceae bacterium]
MKTELLNYELPQGLIAQHPTDKRSDSKMLVVDRSSGVLTDTQFFHIGEYLRAGDCLVLNNTKVLPARFYARRQTGARLEGLFIRAIDETLWEVMLKGAGKVKLNETFLLLAQDQTQTVPAVLKERRDAGKCIIQVNDDQPCETVLDLIGFPPLPPYIKRDQDPAQAAKDRQRYQTVFAELAGAVAAPTAGLHFTDGLLDQLKHQGVLTAKVTLHVGLGTFKPVTSENLADHPIHSEQVEIDQANANIINEARAAGGRIVAIGTTSVRSLESAAHDNKLHPFHGPTSLFIVPGYQYQIVDAMVTNFHLPKSTLLALVGAFTGLDHMFKAYDHAITSAYRFYSYGDAMLIV